MPINNEQLSEEISLPVKKLVEIDNEKLKIELGYGEASTRYGFTQLQNTYLNNSLRFADTKAGALIAVNGVIIKFIADFVAQWTGIAHWLAVTSIALLVISIFLSIIVVFPKNVKDNGKGFIYWGFIANDTLENYNNQIRNEPTSELLDESIRNNYIQAHVLTKKFKWLNIAFSMSIVGYIAITVLGVYLIIAKNWL